MDLEREQFEAKRRARKLELRKRGEAIRAARQRDSREAEALRVIFKLRDEEQPVGFRSYAYNCSMCNHLFTLPRYVRRTDKIRCPPCRLFMRRKYSRDFYWRNREIRIQKILQNQKDRLTRIQEERRKKITERIESKKTPDSTEPVVVWSG